MPNAAQDEFVIRPYRDSDRDAILALAPRLLIGMAEWRDRERSLEAIRQWVTASMNRRPQDGTMLVATEASGKLLGFIGLEASRHFSGDEQGYIGELVVAEHAERRGVGKVLVEAAEDWARGRGYRTLTLVTGAANQPARNFYDRLGFVEEEVRLTKVLEAAGTE